VLPAPPGVLPEPEIHARLVEASGALGESDYAPLRAAAAAGRAEFARTVMGVLADPAKRRLAPVLLYRTLGPTLPHDAAAAAMLWLAAHQCARTNPSGVSNAGHGTGLEAGERLFDAILTSPHGVVITEDDYDAVWQRLPGDRIHLDVPELLAAVAAL